MRKDEAIINDVSRRVEDLSNFHVRIICNVDH